MSSIFLKNLLGSSSSESDVAKYVELLNDLNVNQLNFPGNSKTYEFNINDLQVKEDICINPNASVKQFLFRPLKNFPLAAKILHIPRSRNQINEKRLKAWIEEVKILRKISHGPNIIDSYGYALSEEKLWIFMELMDASLEDVYKYFHKNFYPKTKSSKSIVIPENIVVVIAVCILDALMFCKKQGVMHRDVKPRNMLVNKKGEIKLCGFEASKILESEFEDDEFVGTLLYLPPERFEDPQPYDERNDVWSLGITLVEIAYGDIPYDINGFDSQSHFVEIMNIIKNVDSHEIMSRCFNEGYSDDLRYFVKSCLNELNSRPKYQELIETNLYKSFVAKNENKNAMKLFIQIYMESLNIEENPLDVYAYNNREDAQHGLGKYNEAIADYTKAIELDPSNAKAYYNRGNAEYGLGNYNEAIADYTKAIELNPTYAIAYNNRGLVKKELGLYNEAVDDYTQAIELKPTYADAYNKRGITHVKLGLYNEALDDLKKAIELNPTDAKAYYNRGLVQAELGKYKEAIADYTKAIELKPNYADAYYRRRDLQKQLGNFNEAIADCKKAIELDPYQINFSKYLKLDPLNLNEPRNPENDSKKISKQETFGINFAKVRKDAPIYMNRYTAVWKEKNDQPIDIKNRFFKNYENAKTKKARFEYQMLLIKKLSNESNFILYFYGYEINENEGNLYMELMDMNLKELYSAWHIKKEKFPKELLECITVSVVNALSYCHEKNIIHCDVKPTNVLINQHGNIKLSDFDSAIDLDNLEQYDQIKLEQYVDLIGGTMVYWAPDLFVLYKNVNDKKSAEKSQPRFNPKRDIWSLGITLAETILGRLPYLEQGEKDPNGYDVLKYVNKLNYLKDFTDLGFEFDEFIEVNPFYKRLADTGCTISIIQFICECLQFIKYIPSIEKLQKAEFYQDCPKKLDEIFGITKSYIEGFLNTSSSFHLPMDSPEPKDSSIPIETPVTSKQYDEEV